jgi:outer membrane biosynthesis protein TonB
MTTAITAHDAPKTLALGRAKREDEKREEVAKAIAGARQVAAKTNTPTNVYPHNHQAQSAPQPAPQNQPAPQPEHITTIEAPLPTVEKKGKGPRPAPVRRYSVDLPLYVIDLIHELAHDNRTTKKRVFLEALKAGGIKVKDIDITESGPVLKGRANG